MEQMNRIISRIDGYVWGVPLMFLAQLGAAAYLIQRAL